MPFLMVSSTESDKRVSTGEWRPVTGELSSFAPLPISSDLKAQKKCESAPLAEPSSGLQKVAEHASGARRK